MVIGVVAALTIPVLMQSYKDKQTVTAVLKAASTLTNAFKLTVVDNGEPEDWFNDSDGIVKLYSHMKTIKICPAGEEHDKTCFYDGNQKTLNGTEDWIGYSDWSSALLSDGSTLSFWGFSNDCTNEFIMSSDNKPIYCGKIYYDINGLKEPNIIGRDIFTFGLTKEGVLPDYHDSEVSREAFMTTEGCDMNSSWIHNGKGCTAYIIQNRNVDYLHKQRENE